MNICIDNYFESLEEIANDLVFNCSSAYYLDCLSGSQPSIATDLVDVRKSLVTDEDYEKYESFISKSSLPKILKDEEIAYWAVERELANKVNRIRTRKICEAYDSSHQIFMQEKRLTEHIRTKISKSNRTKKDNELIDYKVFRKANGSSVLKIRQNFVKLCSSLDPHIPEWLLDKFPASPIHVRVDPFCASGTRMPDFLSGENNFPIRDISTDNINFGPNLLIPNSFYLSKGLDPKAYFQEYWDSEVLNLDSVQFSTRGNATYRSFLIEELDDRLNSDGILAGRSIHFDVTNFNDTETETNILSHLDLAVNYYLDENRKLRHSEDLRSGKITDADVRTHIIRIDNVPITIVPIMCLAFFQSKTLVTRFLKYIQ